MVVEITFNLLKMVFNCAEAVFASGSETSDYTAVITSELGADEVSTVDKSEGVGCIF